MTDTEVLPAVSVVVPAYNGGPMLEDCIDSLLTQRFDRPYEVIIGASADNPSDLPRQRDDQRLTVLGWVGRVPAAAARNRGAAAARGELLAFCDADVLADPDWLQRLCDASRGELAVAGAVRNGTPGSRAGTIEYLVEFFDLHPARPVRTAWHGATCNLAVPRGLWEQHGPFPEDMGGGEDTLLTVALRRAGVFRFAPLAVITHRNRTRLRTVLAHQFELGRFTARLGRRSPYRLRFLVRYTPLAPVAAGGRVVSLLARVAAWTPAELPRTLLLLPGLVAAFAAWGAGLGFEGALLDGRALRERARALTSAGAPTPRAPAESPGDGAPPPG